MTQQSQNITYLSLLDEKLVFSGSDVPVQTLIDYIINNDQLRSFLDDNPSVTQEQTIAFLQAACALAEADLRLKNS